MPPVLSKEDYFRQSCMELYHPETEKCLNFFATIFCRLIKTGVALYGPVHLVSELLKRRSLTIKRCFQNVLPNVIWSTGFMAIYGAGTMAVLCFLRQCFGIPFSPLSAALAGFLAPLLALLCERESRRRELSIFLFSQGLEVCWRLLSSRGILPSFSKTKVDVALFSAGLWLWLRVLRLASEKRQNGIGYFLTELLDYQEASQLSRRIETKLVHLNVHFFGQKDSKSNLLTSIMAQLIKSVALGTLIKLAMNLVGVLLRKHNLSSFFQSLYGPDAVRLVGFLSSLSVIFTVLNRYVYKNPAIAGAIAGLSFALYPSTEFAMYLLTKAIAAHWDIWVANKFVPDIPYGSALLGALSSAPTIYASFFESHNLRPSFMRWILKYSPGPYPCVPHEFRPTIPPPGSL